MKLLIRYEGPPLDNMEIRLNYVLEDHGWKLKGRNFDFLAEITEITYEKKDPTFKIKGE